MDRVVALVAAHGVDIRVDSCPTDGRGEDDIADVAAAARVVAARVA